MSSTLHTHTQSPTVFGLQLIVCRHTSITAVVPSASPHNIYMLTHLASGYVNGFVQHYPHGGLPATRMSGRSFVRHIVFDVREHLSDGYVLYRTKRTWKKKYELDVTDRTFRGSSTRRYRTCGFFFFFLMGVSL